MRWDPQQYVRYGNARARPFVDLLARVDAGAPRSVVDLGCGPGTMTALLAQRWPDADVLGIDSSEEMIAAAVAGDRLRFEVGDAAAWAGPADVVVSNATLQWIPSHRTLITRWAAALPPDGWLAFQVPGNFAAPSHTLIRELARAWSIEYAPLAEDTVATPAEYGQLLLDAGLDVDAWETTYSHLLPGDDPVLEWVRGTALRPVLAALPTGGAERFSAELAVRLREAYPQTQHGTVFPFRRVFAVGHRRV